MIRALIFLLLYTICFGLLGLVLLALGLAAALGWMVDHWFVLLAIVVIVSIARMPAREYAALRGAPVEHDE